MRVLWVALFALVLSGCAGMVNYPLTVENEIASSSRYQLTGGQKARIVVLVRQQQKDFPKISFREARTRLIVKKDGSRRVEFCGTVFTGTTSLFTKKVFMQFYGTVQPAGSNNVTVQTPGSDRNLLNIVGVCKRAGLAL